MDNLDGLLKEINKNRLDKEIPDYVEELAEDLSGGWWNYRIIEKTEKIELDDETYEDTFYHIHEVYYKADGSIWSWTERPVTIYFENYGDLKYVIRIIKKASNNHILKLVTDENGDNHLEETNKYIKEVK